MVVLLKSLFHLIHVSRCNFRLNLLYIVSTNDPKCLDKAPRNLKGLEMKNEGEKSEISWQELGHRAFQSATKIHLNIGLWGVAPARVPQKFLLTLRVGALRLSERQGRQFSSFFPHLIVLVPK